MNSISQTYNGKPLIHAWEYLDKHDEVLGIVGRYQNGNEKKEVIPFFNRSGSNWTAGTPTKSRPLFGLNVLATKSTDKPIFIVEGEKAAAALHGLNIGAVTSLGGANSPNKTDWTPLNGFNTVYLLPDYDKPGELYAQAVYRALIALDSPPTVKIIRFKGLPDGGDVVDWLQNHSPDWNGYEPIPTDSKAWAITELKAKLENAEPVPENWGLVTLGTSILSNFDWERPNDISTRTPPVQALPPELIPEPFRAWLMDVSYRMQTPPDFATVSALVVVASVIGAGCSIKPKQFDNWQVIPNLWGAVIAPPSKKKSPSISEATSLLDELQAEYGDLYKQEKAESDFDKLTNENLLGEVKNKAKSAAKGSIESARLKAEFVQLAATAEPEPTRRIFKTNETSVQSMTVLQSQNPRGLLVERDELTGLLTKWETEQGQDERFYSLQGWNGNGSYTDYKIGRGLTEAKSICISLLGGIQPDKLKRYLHLAMQGSNDGLMQRLQLAVWPDMPTHWEYIDNPVNMTYKERAYRIVKVLAEMDFTQFGAIRGDNDKRPYFRFDDEAQAIFIDWLTELEAVRLPSEENLIISEHLSKYSKLMSSLALIFHCIEIADGKAQGNVSAQAARLAVDWCRYLESHARRIYAMAQSPEHEAAVKLAGKIKAKALSSPFTTRDIVRKNWHGLNEQKEAIAACNILIDENWLKSTTKPKPNLGRPPLPEYQINPIFL